MLFRILFGTLIDLWKICVSYGELATADWSVLPEDLVVLIARRLPVIEDFVAFRSTCSSWRKATSLNDFYTSSSCPPKLPLFMEEHFEFPYKFMKKYPRDHVEFILEFMRKHSHGNRIDYEKDLARDDNDDDGHKFKRLIRKAGLEAYDERKFLSLSKAKTCNISFPELNHIAHIQYRGCKGWLIIVEHSDLCLFHPVSRVRIPLPKLPTQADSDGFVIQSNSLKCAAISASPSETSDDYVVMAVFDQRRDLPTGEFELKAYTAFWKPGNLTWRNVGLLPYVLDLNYSNGKFYALTNTAHVWMCEVSGPNPTTNKVVELPWNEMRCRAKLVECGDRLLIVAPYFRAQFNLEYDNDLEVIEIDVIKGSYNSIESLGSYAVFLGRNQGFSIDANRFPGIIEPNAIYFSDGSYQVATPGPNHESQANFGSGIWLNF